MSWHFILLTFIGEKCQTLPPLNDKLLLEPASVLALRIRTKKLKSVDLVRSYIERMKAVNPIINAVVDHRYELALKEANMADDYVRLSGKREQELARLKPFLGIPFTCKNAIGVKGLIMDAGIVIKKGTLATEDSTVVSLMREAGAIPLCVSNVPECLMFIDASNKLYGRTNNPYDLNRNPGGSSGGEGALISSAASILGLGTDIGGSIRIPAYSCGIFCHKPTSNIVSNQGQFPSTYGTELDKFNVTGPMCRYAVDLLPTFKILAGENFNKIKSDVNLQKIKIFYVDEYPEGSFYSPIQIEVKQTVTKVVSSLENHFKTKAQKIDFPISPNNFTHLWLSKLGSAGAVKMENIISSNGPLNITREFLKWCARLSNHTLHILTYFFLQKRHSTFGEEENKLLTKLSDGMMKILGNDGILLFPPQPELPYFHNELIFKFYNVSYTGIFNILGYPVTQCPLGLSKKGLPLGIQVVAAPNNDLLTIAVANEIEEIFGGWIKPFTVSK